MYPISYRGEREKQSMGGEYSDAIHVAGACGHQASSDWLGVFDTRSRFGGCLLVANLIQAARNGKHLDYGEIFQASVSRSGLCADRTHASMRIGSVCGIVLAGFSTWRVITWAIPSHVCI